MNYRLLALLLASASVYAAGNTKDKPKPPRMREPIPLYATYDNDGVNLGFRSDLLYMVYDVPVLTYASEETTVSGVLNSQIENVRGRLSLGCDIALMYTLPNSPGFTFEAGWYHIIARFRRQNNASNILPAHSVGLTIPAVGNGQVHAHIAMNFIDLLLKKQFAFGDWVTLTPGAGLIGGFMNARSQSNFNATTGYFNQTVPITTTFESPVNSAHLYYSSRFKGVGMKLGGSSMFKIWDGLRFTADLYYSVIWGFSRSRLNYGQNGRFEGLTGSNVVYSNHHGRPFFDSLLGLAWEKRFKNDSLYFDVHAGWKFQTYANGSKEVEAEFNDSVQERSVQGQGLEAGATFKF
jgi:hypothetical protein